MKKVLLASVLSFSLAGCLGYEPLYDQTQKVMGDVHVAAVKVDEVGYTPTERRSAQMLNQKLSRVFSGQAHASHHIHVTIDEEEETLAVARDASDERVELNLVAQVKLLDSNDNLVYQTRIQSEAPYNLEDSPYATESGKERARLNAVNVLSDEIVHRLSFFFYNMQKKSEG